MPATTNEWRSTTYANGGAVARLEAATLTTVVQKAAKITIASAYWDKDLLETILKAIPLNRRGSVEVTILVNGFTGRRGEEDAVDLKSLLGSWRRRGLSEFRVLTVDGARLFHTKLFVFSGRGWAKVLIGSANATTAGFGDNEELVLALNLGAVPAAIAEYLEEVERRATPVGESSGFVARTLPAFFRGGEVYYRPSIVTSFRFDLRLPDEMRRRITSLRVRVEGLGARAGSSYNPFAGLLSAEDERELAAATGEEGEQPAKRGRIPLRDYGVQTCYGWWVPTARRDEIEAKLGPARTARKRLLDRIASALKKDSRRLRTMADKRFEQLVQFAEREGLRLGELPTRRAERFDAFLERAKERLADPRWRARAEEPYVAAPVPEIWSDPVSSAEFVDSFFEYLQSIAISKRRPEILRVFESRVPGFVLAEDADEMRDAMARHLSKYGWRERDWTPLDYVPNAPIEVFDVSNPCSRNHWQYAIYREVLARRPATMKAIRKIVEDECELEGRSPLERHAEFVSRHLLPLIADRVVGLKDEEPPLHGSSRTSSS